MQMCKVWMGGEVAGSVCITKEGLYTRFLCQCKLPDNDIYRLLLTCNGLNTDLGICVPQGEYYMVNKVVKSRQIGDGEMCFRITSTTEKNKDRFIPMLSDKPFDYISQLENMMLCVDNHGYGIIIRDHAISQ